MRENNAPQIHGWVIDLKTGLIKDMQVKTTEWELHTSPWSKKCY